jgi:hypothetical protein
VKRQQTAVIIYPVQVSLTQQQQQTADSSCPGGSVHQRSTVTNKECAINQRSQEGSQGISQGNS